METRSIQQRAGCLPAIMEESEGLMPTSESLDESSGKNGNNNFSNSSMARAATVPKGTAIEYSEPNLIPKSKKLIAEPNKKRLPHLFQIPEEKAQSIIINRSGESEIVGVVNCLVIPFVAV